MLHAPKPRPKATSDDLAPVTSSTGPLAELMSELDAACRRPVVAMRERISGVLRTAASNPGLLVPEWRALQPDRYARHVVASDPAGRFTVVSIVWGKDQFSPPHAHHTWCAYAVAEGTLTETLFDFDSARNKAMPCGMWLRRPGYACFAQAGLEQIHRLGNAGTAPAISLHAYGIDSSRVGTHVNRLIDEIEPGR